MSPTLVALVVLFAFLGLRSALRGRSRARPIFKENHIFAGRLTEGLLHALISDRGYMRADTHLSSFSGLAITVDREGACGRLILYPALAFGRDSDLAGLRVLAGMSRSGSAPTVVVVGGSQEFGRTAMEATAPLRTLHIDDDGWVRETRRRFRSPAPRLVLENALDRMAADLADGAFPSIDVETARGLVSEEGTPHLRPLPPYRGVVTSALTVAIILCFAAEVAISRDSLHGEGAALSVVYRMGAIHRPAILAGEWQRLLAAPFLHFGFLHLAMNGWAQWSLGAPIEFLIGPWRFFALWIGSALGASLTSLMFNDSSIAAGASGAIFGLLGAFTTFVFFRKDVLPQPVPRPLRNGVLATLLLNLMISFIPSIDMAAHAGGFLTGAVMALGVVRRDRATPALPARMGPLRLAVALVVLMGVGLTSFQERADQTLQLPEIRTEHRIGELRLPIPLGFAVSEKRTSGLTTVEVDGTPASPFSVTYKVSEPQADEAQALRILKTLRSEQAPSGPSDWIALSRLGTQNLRAIEVVVTAPASCRKQAETMGGALAAAIR
jgi:rhomboid protease GluP